MMKLQDLKEQNINYDWKTIYVGLDNHFFESSILSDYAVELMEKGMDDKFINELAWGIDVRDLPEQLIKIKYKFFPDIEENSNEYIHEQKNLDMYICLN